MSEWQEVKLNTVTSYIKRGVSPKYVEIDGHSIINQKCIRNNRVTYKDSKLLSKTQKIAKEKYLQDGDVLVNSTGVGTLGRVAQYKKIGVSVFCDSHVSIVRANELIDKVFLAHQLSYKESAIENYGKGATNQIELSSHDLGLLKINLPPLPTQQKIAKTLSNYDDLIENNLKRIKLLEESARLTYEEWFLRFRIDGKKLDIDTATGLPFEWEVRKISDFVDTASGGTPSRRKPEEFYKDGTIPWVKTKELKNFMIIDADEHITEQGLKKSSAKMFPANTVLLAMYGNTIGEVTFSTFPTSTNQACCAFLVKDKAYLSYFIHQYLLKNKQKILGYRMGAAQENISQQIIKSIEIEIPSESLLQLFGKRLSEKYNLIKSLHTQNQLLKEARDILLPRLMTGMIDTDNMEIAV